MRRLVKPLATGTVLLSAFCTPAALAVLREKSSVSARKDTVRKGNCLVRTMPGLSFLLRLVRQALPGPPRRACVAGPLAGNTSARGDDGARECTAQARRNASCLVPTAGASGDPPAPDSARAGRHAHHRSARRGGVGKSLTGARSDQPSRAHGQRSATLAARFHKSFIVGTREIHRMTEDLDPYPCGHA